MTAALFAPSMKLRGCSMCAGRTCPTALCCKPTLSSMPHRRLTAGRCVIYLSIGPSCLRYLRKSWQMLASLYGRTRRYMRR